MHKITTFLCLVFSVFVLAAQSKKENYNSLLWRISGNGLSKPSYVYGTIHITDKRVFHFTDSLYKSLEQCEGFAAELDINTFFTEYFNSFMSEAKESNISKKLLVDSLDKKLIARYKTQLEKTFDKPVNEITVGEVMESSDGWMRDMLRNGEMNTFMDAWLFDIARRQGKWVGGIEDYTDQAGLKDSISLAEKIEAITGKYGEASSLMEWMINTYLKQQLDSIDRTDELWQGSRDVLLVRRNIKMARRMDSLARIRSTLFAVGAAHIPGNEGVIYLLRKKGFTVTPVYSKNRISPDSYTYKNVALPWHKVETPDSSYSIEMPGNPIKYRLDSEDAGSPEMNIHIDLGNFRAYITVAIPIPAPGGYSPDSMLTGLLTYYKQTMTITEKNIIVNGRKGKEIAGRDKEDAEIRMQLFPGQSVLVMNAISGYKKNILYGEEPEKFFNSFAINNKPGAVAKKITSQWKRYDFNNLGFSIELPVAYKEGKLERNDPLWEQKYFHAFDLAGQTFMGIMVSSVKKGYYSNIDSSFFEEAAENLSTNMNADIISKNHFLKDGYPAFEATASSEKEKETLFIRILLINKGPRRYMLFTTSDGKSEPTATSKFFDSFKFFVADNKNWSRKFAPDKSFSIWSPVVILPDDESEQQNEIKYAVHDTISNAQVFIDKEIFPAYFWAENDSTLLSDKVKTYIGYQDSVIFNKPFLDGRIRGEDLLVMLDGTHNLKRLRALLNGDTLYTVYTFLPSQFLETDNYQKLFDEFEITYQTTVSSLYNRKPEALLLALQAKDSAGFAKAKEAFEYVTFSKEDVPHLQKALLYPYYDFDSTYYYNVTKSIAELIETLDSNHTSIAFVKENYPTLAGDKELLKPFMLGLLSFIKTDESYALLKELITGSPPKISKEYYWRNGVYDSLVLTKKLFPEILSLAGDPGLYDFVNELTLTMLDTNYIGLPTIKKYKDGFIKSGKRILTLSAEEQEEGYYYYLSLVKILGKINDPEGNEVLKKLGAIDINILKQAVVIAQAAGGQQPDPKNIKLLAESDEFRKNLYAEFKESNKLTLFPKEFLTQKLLAQSAVFNYATDDDYSPDQIEYVGERVETYLGKKQKFYLFKVCFEYEESDPDCYFGVAGPYSPDQKKMESNDDVTEIYWDEDFDSQKISEWLKDMIKRTEEWIKERDTKKND